MAVARWSHAAVLSFLWAAGCRGGPEPAGEEAGAPPCRVVFAGSEALPAAELRQLLEAEIRRLAERGCRKSDADDLAFETERLYRLRGYHFARVEYEHSPAAVVLKIAEGKRVLVREVRFEGNRVLRDEELEELLASRRSGWLGLGERIYVESEAAELRGAVEEVYLERGYREVVVEAASTEFTAGGAEAIITVRVREGPQHVLARVELSPVPLLDPEELAARFRPLLGSAYVPRLRAEVRSRIQEAYADAGRPDAAVEVAAAAGAPEAEGARVPVVLRAQAVPGPLVRIRALRVEGNEETRESFIKARLALGEGDLTNGALLRRSFRRLFETGLFKTVELRLEPLEDRSDTGGGGGEVEERDLVVAVVEGPSLEYFFEAGFGSYDLARARAGVRERNLLGRGLVGRAEVLGSIRGAQGTVGLTDPWFLRSDWSADLPVTVLYRQEPSFTMTRGTVGLRLARSLGAHWSVGAAYRFSLSRVEEFQVEDVEEEEPDLRLGALGPFVEFDSRDDLFAPASGSRVRLSGEVGSPYLAGEIHFLHGGASMSHFLRLLEGTVLTGRVQTEWIQPFAPTDLIPIQERLFLGGENTVRSFEESEVGPRDAEGDPLGGEVRNLLSLEIRQRLLGDLSLAVFGDWGNVARTAAKPFRDFRPAAGVGLRYGLPIGPLRVDAAFNPDQRPDEDLFVIQFAVGMPW